MKRAYYKNPNRWMITYVPVRQGRQIDWMPIIGITIALGFSVLFAWMLWTI